MRKHLALAICILMSVSGCSDQFLDKEEGQVASAKITATSSLNLQSGYAFDMSDAYLRAARSTSNVQDILSFGVLLAAVSASSGAIGTADDAEVKYLVLAGTGFELSARRAAPRASIEAINLGAKRLSCIGAASAMGLGPLDDSTAMNDEELTKAQILTYVSIRDVLQKTREGLVQDVESYSSIVASLTGAAKDPAPGSAQSLLVSDTDEPGAYNKYVEMLRSCI